MSEPGSAAPATAFVPSDDSGIWAAHPVPVPAALLGAVAIGAVAGAAALADELPPAVPAVALALIVAAVGAYGGSVVAVAAALLAAVVQALVVGGTDHTVTVLATAFVSYAVLGVGAASLAHWGRTEAEDADEAEEDVAELEQRHEQRTALLQSVSHDLRTPLGAIRSVVTDLRDDVPYDDATRHALLETVCEEVDRLDAMVANLLSMSRIESGTIVPELQAVDVEEIALERVEALRPLFRDVTLRVDVPDEVPWVEVDYALVDEVLTNLLGNAARYAPAGSTVTVAARAELDDGGVPTGMVVVSVADQGAGVPPADRRRIFEAFEHERRSRTSGLGLTICSGFVAAHGGRIWLDDTPGGGATFCFTVPGIVAAVEEQA